MVFKEQPESSRKKTIQKGKLFVISAPSGTGKTTVVNEVLSFLEKTYSIVKAVTYTSRAPRNNEVDGRDYFFISEKEFLDKKKVVSS